MKTNGLAFASNATVQGTPLRSTFSLRNACRNLLQQQLAFRRVGEHPYRVAVLQPTPSREGNAVRKMPFHLVLFEKLPETAKQMHYALAARVRHRQLQRRGMPPAVRLNRQNSTVALDARSVQILA